MTKSCFHWVTLFVVLVAGLTCSCGNINKNSSVEANDDNSISPSPSSSAENIDYNPSNSPEISSNPTPTPSLTNGPIAPPTFDSGCPDPVADIRLRAVITSIKQVHFVSNEQDSCHPQKIFEATTADQFASAKVKFDATGKAHIGITTHTRFIYLTNASGAWQEIPMTSVTYSSSGAPNISMSELSVAEDNTLHAFFSSDAGLAHWVLNSGVWTSVEVLTQSGTWIKGNTAVANHNGSHLLYGGAAGAFLIGPIKGVMMPTTPTAIDLSLWATTPILLHGPKDAPLICLEGGNKKANTYYAVTNQSAIETSLSEAPVIGLSCHSYSYFNQRAWSLGVASSVGGGFQLTEILTGTNNDKWEPRPFTKSCSALQQVSDFFTLGIAKQTAGDRSLFAGWRKATSPKGFDFALVSRKANGECKYFTNDGLVDPTNSFNPYEFADIWISDPN